MHELVFRAGDYAAPEATCCNHHKGDVFVGAPPSIWISGFAFGLGNIDIDHAVVSTAANTITTTVMIRRMTPPMRRGSAPSWLSHRLGRECMNRFTRAAVTSPLRQA